MNKELDLIYETILDYGIATEDFLKGAIVIGGYNKKTFNKVIYNNSGYRTLKEYQEVLDDYEEYLKTQKEIEK